MKRRVLRKRGKGNSTQTNVKICSYYECADGQNQAVTKHRTRDFYIVLSAFALIKLFHYSQEYDSREMNSPDVFKQLELFIKFYLRRQPAFISISQYVQRVALEFVPFSFLPVSLYYISGQTFVNVDCLMLFLFCL